MVSGHISTALRYSSLPRPSHIVGHFSHRDNTHQQPNEDMGTALSIHMPDRKYPSQSCHCCSNPLHQMNTLGCLLNHHSNHHEPIKGDYILKRKSSFHLYKIHKLLHKWSPRDIVKNLDSLLIRKISNCSF